jgi:hypothetical protein
LMATITTMPLVYNETLAGGRKSTLQIFDGQKFKTVNLGHLKFWGGTTL